MDNNLNPDLPLLCGRSVRADPRYIPSTEYNGRLIHFCTDFCLNAFQADPERFQLVHAKNSNRENKKESL